MSENRKALILLVLLAALAMGVLVASTVKGPGVGGDATIYMESARNLLSGKGLGLIGPRGEFRLLPYFPPFYSLALAALAAVGFPMTGAAHVLNIFLAGALTALVTGMTWRASRSLLLSGAAGGLTAISPVLIPVYSWTISEPLSIFLGLAGLCLLLTYFDGPRAAELIASAVLVGLAMLTRYSAVGYVGAGTLLILLLSQDSKRAKLRDALLFGVIAALPTAIWVFYDLSVTTTVSSRSVLTAQVMAERLADFAPQLEQVVLFWLIPDSWVTAPPYPVIVNHLLVIGLTVGTLAWVAAVWRKHSLEQSDETPLNHNLVIMLASFLVVYLVVIAGVYFTTYPPITIGSRMFSPIHAAWLWLVVMLAGKSMRLWKMGDLLQNGLLIALAVLLAWYGVRSLRIVRQNMQLGLGYNSVEWQNSDTIAAVKMLPQNALIVTNEEMAVLYLTGRATYTMAEIYDDEPPAVFSRYGEGDLTEDNSEKLFREEGAHLVLFNTIFAQMEGAYGDRTEAWATALTDGLQKSHQGNDGAIYQYPRSEP